MNQFLNIVNKEYEKRRISIDENNTSLSFQSFVDDIPFQFNPKYRTIIVSNIDIPEYNTSQIRNILSRPINLILENNVLLEALEDLKRKKTQIQINILNQQLLTSSITIKTNSQSSDSTNILSLSSQRSVSLENDHIPASISVKILPSPLSPFHVSSIRDIHWPSNTNIPIIRCTSINSNELTATFDERLTSDDPFNDAELKTLNDIDELNHLYSVIGSANTIQR